MGWRRIQRLLTLGTLLVAVSACMRVRRHETVDFSFLSVAGTRAVDENGRPVVLKGCNLGNWLLLEMWMLDLKNLGSDGDIPDQFTFDQILRERFGSKRADELMDLYRANWITERDFAIVKSFGFNVVRLPFHYSLLEDDERPCQLKPNAFQWLDHALELAKKHGLYVILDLHGAPGGQSVDHTTGRAGQNQLWADRAYQDRMVWLWRQIAERYKDEPAIAAYDLLNEPFGDYCTEQHRDALLHLMDRIYGTIREVDVRHILIFPGTREGIGFYGAPADRGWTNVMFTEHHYPGVMYGTPSLEIHIEHVNRTLYWLKHYLQRINAPLLVGEFNVVFRRSGGAELMRYYFDLFARNGWWGTMWSYKLIHRVGGLGRDNWYLVTNAEPAPQVNLWESSYDEIAAFFKWFGAVPYAVDEELRSTLTRQEPSQLVLEMGPLLLEAPALDDVSGWMAEDIAAEPRGGQRVESPARMDVYGGGQDIWNTRDEFRFVWKEVEGNFDVEACIVNFIEAHPYSKAGIMIRGGAFSEAAHILLHVFPDGQVVVGFRERVGATMREVKFPIRPFPIHLKLSRRGQQVRARYRSREDAVWRDAGEWNCEWMKSRVWAGLAVLSHDRRFLACASFDHIRVVGAETRAP